MEENKIIIKLGGGLGNQLFQYALGRSLALTKGKEVKFDLSWFEIYKERVPKLNHFNTAVEIATKRETKKVKKYGRKFGRFAFLYNLFFINESIYIKPKDFGFNPEIFDIRKSVYLDGIWHSEKYFKNIENIIRQKITLKETPGKYFKQMEEKMNTTNSVSLHIRHGDYLTMQKAIDIIGVCPIDYYYKAVEKISSKKANPTFFIFSDEINWVKENLKIDFPMIFVSNGKFKDYEELMLMSKCKHNIIANSSFSWWGAWLNQNPNKVVIAPKNWFKAKNINTKDLIPDDWIKI